MNQIIEVISTGGTIDSFFDKKKDLIVPLSKSVLPEYFSDIARVKGQILFYELCMKDSRDFDMEADTTKLISHMRSSVASKFIITIGTYAMPDVALQVSTAFDWASLGKKIIFTGAMSPMVGFLNSDGGFNLGFALTQFNQHPQTPVLLAMNGESTTAGRVAKDLRTGTFRPVDIEQIREDNLKNPIHLISTGGSIDGAYDALDGISIQKTSKIPEYLRSLELHKKISFTETKPLKHSFDLQPQDFQRIFESAKNSPHQNIIITVGTYAMAKLEAFLQKNKENLQGKRIIITGARYTLLHDDLTDATFNIGYSIGAMGTLPEGIHIALCGKIVSPGKVMQTLYTPPELKKIEKRLNEY